MTSTTLTATRPGRRVRHRLVGAVLVSVVLLVGCSDDGSPGDEGARTTTTTASADGGTLELCRDVPDVHGDVLGTLGGTQNPDDLLMGVISTYTNEHADTFGGRWIDRDAGGVVVVAFTDDPEVHRTALLARGPTPTDDAVVVPPPSITDTRPIGEWDQAIDVVQVRYPYDELSDESDRVLRAVAAVGLEVHTSGPMITKNRLGIDVGAVTPEQVAAAADALAGVVPLDLVCLDGVPADEVPPPIDAAAPLDVIAVAGADGRYADDVEVTCGDARFTLGELRGRTPVDEAGIDGLDAELVDGLAGRSSTGWSVLTHEGDEAVLVTVDGDRLAMNSFERTRAGWRSTGGDHAGACELRTVLPDGLSEVDWVLDLAFGEPAPDDVELHLLATERTCASGGAMGGRLLEPQVVATDDVVRITFAATRLGGAQTCPSNPSTPVTVALDAPLGERELREGTVLGTVGEVLDEG